jgi:hypothetical protein
MSSVEGWDTTEYSYVEDEKEEYSVEGTVCGKR